MLSLLQRDAAYAPQETASGRFFSSGCHRPGKPARKAQTPTQQGYGGGKGLPG